MQALRDVTSGSAYEVDQMDGGIDTIDATSTALQSASSCEQSHDLSLSYTSGGNSPSTSLVQARPFPSADTNSTSGLIVTSGSVSDGTTHRVVGPTPSSAGDGSPELSSSRIHKRQRNTEAARRYRQRKLDRVSELEEALDVMAKERDELKLKLAKAEAEAGVLRGLVGK